MSGICVACHAAASIPDLANEAYTPSEYSVSLSLYPMTFILLTISSGSAFMPFASRLDYTSLKLAMVMW
jgi:hypothetical protein